MILVECSRENTMIHKYEEVTGRELVSEVVITHIEV